MCAPYRAVRTEPVCCEPRHRRLEASSVSLCRHWRRTFWTLPGTYDCYSQNNNVKMATLQIW